MTATFERESSQHLAELERLAYINGDRLTADLLGALADAKEAEEKFPEELDAAETGAYDRGRAEGVDDFRDALLPLLDGLEGLAAGRVTKAEVKALHDRLTAVYARVTGDLLNPALHPHAPMGEPVADCERISATALERLLTQLNGG